ncbi:hypothetical protein HPP92_024288 [Vanilla planifolia]|uniref:Uncharacterized protein n=1 Tax=Vanilla planifolia TaxID=51239 RepID=A0A835PMA3_VANPL|nr:hypothetical protein HPP92_024615 [Vanilla planifolia]KAG0456500.1 hypothetical protein HPP92_024288 [Vanilla planifolia]
MVQKNAKHKLSQMKHEEGGSVLVVAQKVSPDIGAVVLGGRGRASARRCAATTGRRSSKVYAGEWVQKRLVHSVAAVRAAQRRPRDRKA